MSRLLPFQERTTEECLEHYIGSSHDCPCLLQVVLSIEVAAIRCYKGNQAVHRSGTSLRPQTAQLGRILDVGSKWYPYQLCVAPHLVLMNLSPPETYQIFLNLWVLQKKR